MILLDIPTDYLVNWSRLQFAMTAMFYYLFVPLTLGLSFMLALMETMWVRTGKVEWLNATKFWMKLFAINFAIGIATGLILEFQFGSNWSNYSWFVGDIFGAPLAIEGLFAFFLEATFFAVMFLGWNKVSKQFHLFSTWMVFLGANISALWILVANAWMQNPVGTDFNPITARNEMGDFWSVILSPTAMNKFFHTVTSAFTLSACFVVGVSSWFILKKRNVEFARNCILLGSIFGVFSIAACIFTGDTSGKNVVKTQPMKFAAMEGLNRGGRGLPLTVIGIPTNDSSLPDHRMKTVKYSIGLPHMLSFLGYYDFNAYIPGILDIMEGYTSEDGKVYAPMEQRIANGKAAVAALSQYKEAQKNNDEAASNEALQILRENYTDFGYGHLDSPYEAIPLIKLTFYSFRIMVGLGFLFLALFLLAWWYAKKRKYHRFKFIPYLTIACVPLAYIASQCGWIVAEVGRQP